MKEIIVAALLIMSPDEGSYVVDLAAFNSFEECHEYFRTTDMSPAIRRLGLDFDDSIHGICYPTKVELDAMV